MFGHNFLQVASTYNTMAGMADAGIDLVKILDFQSQSGAEKLLARRLLIRLQRGQTLNGAMGAEGFSRLDTAMIKAAEETGSLVTIFRSLFDYYQDRYSIERTLKFAFLKPMFMFFVSTLTTAFVPYFLGRIGLLGFFMRGFLPTLVAVGLLTVILRLFWRISRSSRLDDKLEKYLDVIPVTRLLGQKMALERFFIAFSVCTRAGASVNTMIAIFRAVANHRSLKGAHVAFDNVVERKGFAEAMKAAGIFTDDQIAAVHVGEFSGRLEQQLAVIVKDLRGDVDFQMQQFGEWAPRVLYAVMGALIFVNMFF